MKKGILLAIICLLSIQLFAQTDGISYQAVIIGPDNQELPGVDAEGNILPNATIAIRFSILDATNTLVYQEMQTTNTDQYGRINLLVGKADPDAFTLIEWDGTSKDLKVEIDFSGAGSNFVDMSREELTFVPYSYHRNITARGTLVVDDTTDLNGELKVQGPTNLNSTLNVNDNNATNLSGSLDVEGATNLKSSFDVDGITNLKSSLFVNNGGATFLSGTLKVIDTATFGATKFSERVTLPGVDVDGSSNLNGQVTVNVINDMIDNDDPVGDGFPGSDVLTNQNDFNKYPLKVEGSYQGIAIKVKEGRGRQNNFISFWDDNQMWGRIEGLTLDQQRHDPEYISAHAVRITDVTINAIELAVEFLELGAANVGAVASITSSTACVGVGACVTAPIPSFIVSNIFNVLVKIGNWIATGGNLLLAIYEEGEFVGFKRANIGVSYQSGAGDYAEWLPKENFTDIFTAGELIGVKNGKVTKNTWGVDKVMIVSTRPIVLGNMPEPKDEVNYVKIAFMGQVPVKVLGKVAPGDYILPNILANGFAKAVHPKDMITRDYKNIAGVAWNVIEEITDGLSIVNVAVGINTNDLSEEVAKQEEELNSLKLVYDQLKIQMQENNTVLASLVPGYAEATGITKNATASQSEKKTQDTRQKNMEDLIVFSDENDIIYFEISKEQIETAITMAREQYVEMFNDQNQLKKLFIPKNNEAKDALDNLVLMPIKDHPFWQKMDNDPAYRDEIIQFIQSGMEKAYHTHKKYSHKFTNLIVRK